MPILLPARLCRHEYIRICICALPRPVYAKP